MVYSKNQGKEAVGLINSTVKSFAGRMRRKLKEREAEADLSGRSRQERQKRLLEALNTVRRALQEASRIKLSERFHFEVSVSDWEGWPRLELILFDAENAGSPAHSLMVSAHDRQDSGTLELSLNTGVALAKLHLSDPSECEKLAVVLKRSLRHFLEVVTAYILNPQPTLVKTDPIALEEMSADVREQLDKVNLFTEETSENKNVADTSDVVPIDNPSLSTMAAGLSTDLPAQALTEAEALAEIEALTKVEASVKVDGRR